MRSFWRGGFPLAAFVFIGLGLVLLLQNLGILPWALWREIWRFWPVILILIGLNLLFGRRYPWAPGLIALAILAAIVGLAAWQTTREDKGRATTIEESLGNYKSARFEVNFGAGTLEIDSLPSGSGWLAQGQLMDSGNGSINKERSSRNDRAVLKVGIQRHDDFFGDGGTNLSLALNRDIPIELEINAGAAKTTLNLRDLDIYSLALNAGAAKLDVVMPSRQGTTEASVKIGAADLDIRVPEGMAARIQVKAPLSSLDIDTQRFPRSGDYFLSPGYATSASKLDLSLDGGVSDITVR